jgi:23S rRNA (adenine-N6)-dimethyltransferase
VAVRRRSAPGAPGQHFLRSSRLAHALVAEAAVATGDLVVDVGAGAGALTRALADAGARVVALEADPALARELRRRFAGQEVTVLEIDARHWSWPHEPFAVVANLPFAGSGAILGHLLRDPTTRLRRADVIVQWELARKHTAVWPATARAVCWAAWFDVSLAGKLASSAFSPPPSVTAGLLRIERRARPRVEPSEHEAYRRFVEGAFASGKPLVRALAGTVSPRELRRLAPVLGVDAGSHARDLDARQWAALFAFARERRGRALRA